MIGRRLAYPLALALALTPPSVAATKTPTENEALVAAHAWWDAFAKGDESRVTALSATDLSVTLSVGATLDRGGAIAAAREHAGSAYAGTVWSDDRVRFVARDVAVVTSTATEGFANVRTAFRYLTVLARQGSQWHVAAAQSTRVLAPTPRSSVTDAGLLASYAGVFRTPGGQTLEVKPQPGHLLLVEPGGAQRRLDPIARDLFEFEKPQASSGVLRFLFVRDGAGRVTGVTRLGPQVTTFPRVDH